MLDRWIARVEDALIAGGADEQAPTFDALVGSALRLYAASPHLHASTSEGYLSMAAKRRGCRSARGTPPSWQHLPPVGVLRLPRLSSRGLPAGASRHGSSEAGAIDGVLFEQ